MKRAACNGCKLMADCDPCGLVCKSPSSREAIRRTRETGNEVAILFDRECREVECIEGDSAHVPLGNRTPPGLFHVHPSFHPAAKSLSWQDIGVAFDRDMDFVCSSNLKGETQCMEISLEGKKLLETIWKTDDAELVLTVLQKLKMVNECECRV